MPVTNPMYGPGFPRAGVSPAMDALQQLGSASPSSGMVANPHRLTEPPDLPNPSPKMTPPPATPPSGVAAQDQVLASLRMAYPGDRQNLIPRRPLQGMAPERREKPSIPALEG